MGQWLGFFSLSAHCGGVWAMLLSKLWQDSNHVQEQGAHVSVGRSF